MVRSQQRRSGMGDDGRSGDPGDPEIQRSRDHGDPGGDLEIQRPGDPGDDVKSGSRCCC